MSVCDCSDDAPTADEVHASVQKYHRGYEPIFDSGFTSIFSRFPQSLASQFDDLTHLEVDTLDPEDGGTKPFVYLRCPGHINGCASCGYHACHIDSLIVAISGTACLTATGNIESGHGVYFGHQNPHNIQRHVDEEDGVRPSAQREAIRAAIAGLDAVMPFCGGGGSVGLLWPPRRAAVHIQACHLEKRLGVPRGDRGWRYERGGAAHAQVAEERFQDCVEAACQEQGLVGRFGCEVDGIVRLGRRC
ncbi:hypothetical protein CGCSCA4_v009089 [Colletotrichum siamense]|nr:hypothetical protein CGCSCA4_v009089 [Colletotrichum siamense]